MKRSYIYEICHDNIDSLTINSNMTLQQWFITDLNYNEPLTPSIEMIRHEKK